MAFLKGGGGCIFAGVFETRGIDVGAIEVEVAC